MLVTRFQTSIRCVNLDDVDFSPESGTRAVSLEGAEGFALMGRIDDAFTPAEPIRFLTP